MKEETHLSRSASSSNPNDIRWYRFTIYFEGCTLSRGREGRKRGGENERTKSIPRAPTTLGDLVQLMGYKRESENDCAYPASVNTVFFGRCLLDEEAAEGS